MVQARLIFERQWLHASFIAASLAGVALVSDIGEVGHGQLWGVPTPVWLWLSVLLAIIHQVFVWFCWRTQLHGSLLTRALGNLGFPAYAVGFSVLGISRAAVVFILAISNRNTLPLDPTALKMIAAVAAIPAVYARLLRARTTHTSFFNK